MTSCKTDECSIQPRSFHEFPGLFANLECYRGLSEGLQYGVATPRWAKPIHGLKERTLEDIASRKSTMVSMVLLETSRLNELGKSPSPTSPIT